MGLRVEIFTHALYKGCSNGGISAHWDRATVVNAEGPFEPAIDAPAILIDSHMLGILRAVPAEYNEERRLWIATPGRHMAGGAYVACSDSRMSDLLRTLIRASMKAAIAKTPPDLRKQLSDAYNAFPELSGTFYGAIALHDRQER